MALPVIYNLFSKEITSDSQDVAVVIFTCKPVREPVVYDVSGINPEEVDDAVNASVRLITTCCNYHYKFVTKIGNVYFFE